MRFLCFLFSAALLLGCEATTASGPVPSCDHVVDSLTPDSGPVAGGTEVVVSGLFISTESVRDTVVRVGGIQAEVLGMTREGCETCDACTNEALLCVTCERECRGLAEFTDGADTLWPASECLETLTFETPAGSPGPAPVLILNGRGTSQDSVFTYGETGGDDDDSAGDDDDSAGDDDDSAGDDDDSAADDDDSAADDDDSAADDDDSAR